MPWLALQTKWDMLGTNVLLCCTVSNVLHFEFVLCQMHLCIFTVLFTNFWHELCCFAQAMCFWNMVRSCASSPAIEWELWLCLSRGYNTLSAELERIKFHVSCAWLYNVTWVIFWTCMCSLYVLFAPGGANKWIMYNKILQGNQLTELTVLLCDCDTRVQLTFLSKFPLSIEVG